MDKLSEWAYTVVQVRDMHRCGRCGMAGNNWHHRRSKSIRDGHTHCPCNGVWLCGTGSTGCHGWVHANPFVSRKNGWIVSRHEAVPGSIPMLSAMHKTWVWLDCDGDQTVQAEVSDG
jgi:hypothetical protein